MTLTNKKIFGLDVNRYLADAKDADASLRNIGIEPRDLAIIFGSSQVPTTSDDFRSLSRLKQPLYKKLDRYNKDSGQFIGILNKRAGTSGLLFGNLNVNGRLSGSAIRYRYVEGSGNSATKKIADISTSRVSAWSSSDPHAETDMRAAISYGARISIIPSASGRSYLKFGTQATSSNTNGLNISGTPRLQTTMVPQKVEFDSEIPTSKVKINLGGSDVWVYAMKGIPVSFTGFFRNLYGATVSVASIDAGGTKGVIKPSWKIKRTDNPNDYANFKNTNSINYYSSRGRERNIEIYYPPDSITSLKLNSANISEMPEVKFASMQSLNLNSNNIANFPDFVGGVAPVLTDLRLRNNRFYLSETADQRKLRADGSGNTILNKIPTTVQYLDIAGNFYGSIDQGIFTRFTALKTLNLGRSGGAYFHPESGQTATVPNVSPTVENYYVYSNDFRNFDNTDSATSKNIRNLDQLKSLHLSSNYYLSDNLSPSLESGISSNVIQYVYCSATNLPVPDLNNKATLIQYHGTYQRSAGTWFNSGGTYKFDNCSKLTHLYTYACSFSGAFPKFTNENLKYIDMRYNNMTGGGPTSSASDTDFVLPRDTFLGAPKLETFYSVNSWGGNTDPIHPDAFTFTPELRNLYWYSYYKTGGSLPDLTNCGNLWWLHLSNNRFGSDGSGMPTFSTNTNVGYIYLHNNQLNGTIPEIKNLSSLDYLYLYNNNFDSIIDPGSLPNLRRFYVHINNIQGAIPDFTTCPRLQYLALFRNKFNAYTVGSFKELYNIRYIDVSNNNLPQSAINKIVDDLYENWTSYKRGGVSINLRNNTAIGASIKTLPSNPQLDKIYELRAGGWSITID